MRGPDEGLWVPVVVVDVVADGGDGHVDAGPDGEDDFLEGEGGTGGCAELGGVVGFGDGEMVALELGESRR